MLAVLLATGKQWNLRPKLRHTERFFISYFSERGRRPTSEINNICERIYISTLLQLELLLKPNYICWMFHYRRRVAKCLAITMFVWDAEIFIKQKENYYYSIRALSAALTAHL